LTFLKTSANIVKIVILYINNLWGAIMNFSIQLKVDGEINDNNLERYEFAKDLLEAFNRSSLGMSPEQTGHESIFTWLKESFEEIQAEKAKELKLAKALIRLEDLKDYWEARLSPNDLRCFSEDLAAICFDGKWGYLDKNGTIAINLKYQECTDFSDGLARVKLNNKWGIIDKNEKVIFDFIYNKINDFYDDLAVVTLNRRKGVMNKAGEIIVDFCTYGDIENFSNGFAKVYSITNDEFQNNVGLINKTGKLIAETKYWAIEHFTEGLAPATIKIKNFFGSIKYNSGFINQNGEVVIDLIYTAVHPFSNGQANVMKEGKQLTINKVGQIIKT